MSCLEAGDHIWKWQEVADFGGNGGGRTHYVVVSPLLDITRGDSLASCNVMVLLSSGHVFQLHVSGNSFCTFVQGRLTC